MDLLSLGYKPYKSNLQKGIHSVGIWLPPDEVHYDVLALLIIEFN